MLIHFPLRLTPEEVKENKVLTYEEIIERVEEGKKDLDLIEFEVKLADFGNSRSTQGKDDLLNFDTAEDEERF